MHSTASVSASLARSACETEDAVKEKASKAGMILVRVASQLALCEHKPMANRWADMTPCPSSGASRPIAAWWTMGALEHKVASKHQQQAAAEYIDDSGSSHSTDSALEHKGASKHQPQAAAEYIDDSGSSHSADSAVHLSGSEASSRPSSASGASGASESAQDACIT